MAEIPGSPVSRHDLDTIRLALARSFTDGFAAEERAHDALDDLLDSVASYIGLHGTTP